MKSVKPVVKVSDMKIKQILIDNLHPVWLQQ